MYRYLSLPALAVLIGSCAPISEDQCRSGDWGSIGLADGKKGRYASILNEYAETCAEFGVSPVRDIYLQARDAGLQFYCTPDNAYRVGRAGDRLNSVCAPSLMPSLRTAFERGEKYHEIEEEIDRLEGRIDTLRAELSGAREQPQSPVIDSRVLQIKSQIDSIRHDIFMLDLQKDRYARFP